MEQDVGPLGGLEATREADDGRLGRRAGIRPRSVRREVGAEVDGAGPTREALALGDAPGGGVADVDAARVTQRSTLDPAERGRVALVEILRAVEQVGGSLPVYPAQQQDLGGGEG